MRVEAGMVHTQCEKGRFLLTLCESHQIYFQKIFREKLTSMLTVMNRTVDFIKHFFLRESKLFFFHTVSQYGRSLILYSQDTTKQTETSQIVEKKFFFYKETKFFYYLVIKNCPYLHFQTIWVFRKIKTEKQNQFHVKIS